MEGKGWGQMEGGQGAVPAPPAGHGHTAQACSMGDAPYNDHTSDPLKALVLLLNMLLFLLLTILLLLFLPQLVLLLMILLILLVHI